MNKTIKFTKVFFITLIFITGIVCIIASGGGGSGDDGDGSDGDTSTPQSYTASGNYNYNQDTGELLLTFALSDFFGCGPVVGDEFHEVESITETALLLNQGEEDEMTWTRNSGTAGDITGTWDFEDDGNNYTITFNADMTISVVGKILTCTTEWDLVFTIDLDSIDTNFLCIPGDFEGDDTREDDIIIEQTGSTFTMATSGGVLNGTISGETYTFSGSWIEPDDDGAYTIKVKGSFKLDSSTQISGSDTVSGSNDAGNFCTWDETFVGTKD